VQVLWDGAQIADVTFVQAANTTTNMGWTYYEFGAVAGDASTRLTFTSLSGTMLGDAGVQTWYGPVLDDVSVSTIPEPSMLMLSLAGLFLIPAGRRKYHGAR
jgi:hypothetical protein